LDEAFDMVSPILEKLSFKQCMSFFQKVTYAVVMDTQDGSHFTVYSATLSCDNVFNNDG
jgi:hypothetical protein